MKHRFLIAAVALAAAPPAIAGPPYLADDPVPTDTDHFEIYAFVSGEHSNSIGDPDLDADAGLDLNYGAFKGVQLTATLPVSFSHDRLSGWRSGTGDLELGIKYRFLNDEKNSISAAIFPRLIVPTSSLQREEKARLLLPLWIEKDWSGGVSLFGGGGYELNRGRGNRDFFQAAVALSKDLSKTMSVGGEIAWQQPESVGGTNQIRAGLGSVLKLGDHYALLLSGGPTWAEHRTGYHFYAALGLDF